jgi:hypothetical protein
MTMQPGSEADQTAEALYAWLIHEKGFLASLRVWRRFDAAAFEAFLQLLENYRTQTDGGAAIHKTVARCILDVTTEIETSAYHARLRRQTAFHDELANAAERLQAAVDRLLPFPARDDRV